MPHSEEDEMEEEDMEESIEVPAPLEDNQVGNPQVPVVREIDTDKTPLLSLEEITNLLELSQRTISDEEFYNLISNPSQDWELEENVPKRESVKVVPIIMEDTVRVEDDPSRVERPEKPAHIHLRYFFGGEFHKYSFGPVANLDLNNDIKSKQINRSNIVQFLKSKIGLPQVSDPGLELLYKDAIQTNNRDPIRRLQSFVVNFGQPRVFRLPDSASQLKADKFTMNQLSFYEKRTFQNFIFVTYQTSFEVCSEVEVDDQVTYYGRAFHLAENNIPLVNNQRQSKVYNSDLSNAASVLKTNTVWDRVRVFNHTNNPTPLFGIQRVKRRIFPNMAVVQFKMPLPKNAHRNYFMQCGIFTDKMSEEVPFANLTKDERYHYGNMTVMFRCWPATEKMVTQPTWARTELYAFYGRGLVPSEKVASDAAAAKRLATGKQKIYRTFPEKIFGDIKQIMGSPFIQTQFKRKWGSLIYVPKTARKFIIETAAMATVFSDRYTEITSALPEGARFNDPCKSYKEAVVDWGMDGPTMQSVFSAGKIPIKNEIPRIAPPFRLLMNIRHKNAEGQVVGLAKTLVATNNDIDASFIPHSEYFARRKFSFGAQIISALYSREMGFDYTTTMGKNGEKFEEIMENPDEFIELHKTLVNEARGRLSGAIANTNPGGDVMRKEVDAFKVRNELNIFYQEMTNAAFGDQMEEEEEAPPLLMEMDNHSPGMEDFTLDDIAWMIEGITQEEDRNLANFELVDDPNDARELEAEQNETPANRKKRIAEEKKAIIAKRHAASAAGGRFMGKPNRVVEEEEEIPAARRPAAAVPRPAAAAPRPAAAAPRPAAAAPRPAAAVPRPATPPRLATPQSEEVVQYSAGYVASPRLQTPQSAGVVQYSAGNGATNEVNSLGSGFSFQMNSFGTPVDAELMGITPDAVYGGGDYVPGLAAEVDDVVEPLPSNEAMERERMFRGATRPIEIPGLGQVELLLSFHEDAVENDRTNETLRQMLNKANPWELSAQDGIPHLRVSEEDLYYAATPIMPSMTYFLRKAREAGESVDVAKARYDALLNRIPEEVPLTIEAFLQRRARLASPVDASSAFSLGDAYELDDLL